MKRKFYFVLLFFTVITFHSFSKQLDYLQKESKKILTAIQSLPNFVGEWKIKIAISDGIEENYANGTSNISLVLNSRYLLFKNSFIYPSGFLVELWALLGYNLFDDNYSLFLLDNFSSLDVKLSGTYIKDENKFIFEGFGFDLKNKKRIPIKIIIFWEREDKFWFEYYSKEQNDFKLHYKIMFLKKKP